jgi:hypothetical protein
MNREQLIAAMQSTADEKPRPVEVPGWGKVFVRSLTVAEADAGDEQQMEQDKKNRRRLARGAARVLCDEKGNRLFDPENDADVDMLAKQPWKLLRNILADPEDSKPKGN